MDGNDSQGSSSLRRRLKNDNAQCLRCSGTHYNNKGGRSIRDSIQSCNEHLQENKSLTWGAMQNSTHEDQGNRLGKKQFLTTALPCCTRSIIVYWPKYFLKQKEHLILDGCFWVRRHHSTVAARDVRLERERGKKLWSQTDKSFNSCRESSFQMTTNMLIV